MLNKKMFSEEPILIKNIRGRLHNETGPAQIYHYSYDGFQGWHIDGYLHRENGPARNWTKSGENAFACFGEDIS